MARATTRVKVKNLKQPECVLYLQSLNNNFRLTLCDFKGNVLRQETAGRMFKGTKKSTPHAANVTAENMARWSKDRGVASLHTRIKGVGIGPEMALRTICNKGLAVKSVKNITSVPHGGCKPRKRPRK